MTHRDPKILKPDPPGAYTESVPHPSGRDDHNEIELAIFKDHRYSFFYWMKWTHQRVKSGIPSPPTLLTIDWHRDLAPPSDDERNELNRLNSEDLHDVRRFTTDKLDPHNDSHLLSAAWLNGIGDIILLKNYGTPQKQIWKDKNDNQHAIIEHTDIEVFTRELLDREDDSIYLDIDLDYFIQNKVAPYQRTNVQIYEDDEIRSVVEPGNRLFKYLTERLMGITLATEPRYCGGIRNSNHILEVILEQWFSQEMKWLHLSS